MTQHHVVHRMLQQQPLLLPAVCWLAGLAWGGQLPSMVWLGFGLLALLVLICWRPAAWWATALLFTTLGAAFGSLQQPAAPLTLPQGAQVYTLSLSADIAPTATGYRVWARCDSISHAPTPPVLVLLDVPQRFGASLQAGSRVHIIGSATPLPHHWPLGYRSYLQQQGIGQQLRVHQLLHSQAAAGFDAWLLRQRDGLATQIALQVGPDAAGAATVALVLGHKAYMPADLKTAYRATGTLHVLAISGMHLSVIVAALGFVLLRVGARGRYAWPPLLIIAAALLAYGVLVGASPAIVRALVMGCLLLLALWVGRQPQLLNVLAVSCMLQTAIWSSAVYDVGFQLSYTAVLGIALLAPHSNTYLQAWPAWLRAPAQLLAATLAAQLFTAPVILYHFGQFPPLFLLSNLLAIPLASLATLSGFAFLLLHPIPFIGPVLGWCTAQLMHGLNAWVATTAAWAAPWQTTGLSSSWAIAILSILTAMGLWGLHRKQLPTQHSLPF